MRPKRKQAATKVLIVDDHPITRQGLAQLVTFEPDLEVCGEAKDANQALNLVEQTRPNLVLLDITLPDKNGLEVIKDLQTLDPDLLVLVVSMHEEGLYAERVLRAGGRGYIMKQEGGRVLMQAIRKVLSGQIHVSEKIAAKILEVYSGGKPQANASRIHQLTDREFEVFQLIGKGMSTREIASQLHLSVKTVEVHRLNIKSKLNLKTANNLVTYAVRWTESEPSGAR